jgi:hypothetical protein
MTRPNITPGPWHTDAGFIHARFSGDGRVHDICDPRCAPPDLYEEMDANEIAIAAVPDVLAALERCLPDWHAEDDPKQHDGLPAGEISLGDMRAIKAALLKAGYTF